MWGSNATPKQRSSSNRLGLSTIENIFRALAALCHPAALEMAQDAADKIAFITSIDPTAFRSFCELLANITQLLVSE
jgi:hypothetical protein